MAESSDVSRVLALCEELGLEPFHLDDLVHDCMGEGRAAAYNSGEDVPALGLKGTDPVDSFDDAFSSAAADINNQGMDAQVAFLLEHNDLNEVERLVRDLG